MQVEQEMAAGSASSQLGGGEGEAQEPSAEDMKAQLFRSLQAKGILSQLKVTLQQLRLLYISLSLSLSLN